MEHNCFSNKNSQQSWRLLVPHVGGQKQSVRGAFYELKEVTRHAAKAKLSFKTAYCNKSFLKSGARKRRELFLNDNSSGVHWEVRGSRYRQKEIAKVHFA